MTARIAGAGLVCAVLLGMGAGCTEGGGGEGRPTALPSPTRTLPTRTATPTDEPTPEPSDETSDAPTQEPTPEPTDEPTEQPTEDASDRPTLLPTDRPSDRPTEQPTEQPATSEAGPSESPTPSASESAPAEEEASDEADSEGDSPPSWVWWLLAAVVVGAGALTWFLVARSRRRRAWQEQLAAAERELAWLARELLPQLRRTGSVEQVAGGWQVALPRVAAAEDQLTVLESTAPDEPAGARATELRDALREARARVEAATRGGAQEMWALDLDEAIGRLESALAPEPGAQP